MCAIRKKRKEKSMLSLEINLSIAYFACIAFIKSIRVNAAFFPDKFQTLRMSSLSSTLITHLAPKTMFIVSAVPAEDKRPERLIHSSPRTTPTRPTTWFKFWRKPIKSSIPNCSNSLTRGTEVSDVTEVVSRRPQTFIAHIMTLRKCRRKILFSHIYIYIYSRWTVVLHGLPLRLPAQSFYFFHRRRKKQMARTWRHKNRKRRA